MDGAILDRAELDRQTFGDAALAAELLALFVEQCGRLAPHAADPARGPGERGDAAHTLKGAALAVGARRLAEAAAGLEAALTAGAGAEAESAALAAAARDAAHEAAQAA